jgi:hypothetical protein
MGNNNATPERHSRESDASLPKHIREIVAEVASLKEAGAEALTDTLAHWLTAHYVTAAKRAVANAGPDGLDLKALRGLIADVVALRRGDHSAERLSVEREQLELNRQLLKDRMEKLFWEWATKPENKSRICRSSLSADERARRIREILGVAEPPNVEEPRAGLSPENTPEDREGGQATLI